MAYSEQNFDALLSQLEESYFNELPEKFDDMEAYILQLMQQYDQASFETLFRLVHSMKGSAGTYGYDVITTICHNLEDSFVGSRTDDSISKDNAELWLMYIDLMRRTYESIANGLTDFGFVNTELDSFRRHIYEYEYRGLIVIKSAVDVAFIQQSFDHYPVSFSIVRDGLEALERLLTDKFDFVISSNQLPRLNGVAMLSAIKLTPGINRAVKTVLITSQEYNRKSRDSDPDFVIVRNKHYVQSLEQLASRLIE